MEKNQKHLEDISEIRSMMERASKVISLSGISGISAGIVALIGASVAFWHLNVNFSYPLISDTANIKESILFLFVDAFITFALALGFAIFFTTRNSRRKNTPIWDYSSKQLIMHMIVPLIVAFLFIIALVYYQFYLLILPSSLIFYGLSLINAGKYTFRDIKILGFLEIILGFIGLVFTEWALYLWAFGFGILHIIYGTMMYFKYEK